MTVGTGVAGMKWRNGHENQLFVSTIDGLVRLIDVKSGKILADCSGHTATILSFSQSSDGSWLSTASDDGTCKIFDVGKIMTEAALPST